MRLRYSSAGLVFCVLTFVAVAAYAQSGQPFRALQTQISALAARVLDLESQSSCSCTGAPTWDSGWVTAPASTVGSGSFSDLEVRVMAWAF